MQVASAHDLRLKASFPAQKSSQTNDEYAIVASIGLAIRPGTDHREAGMDRVTFIKHNGKEILLLDFSNCKPGDVFLIIDEAKKTIRSRPENSVLTLTNVTNMRFDDRVSQQMKEFTVHNRPYVRAAAVIGVEGVKKIIMDAVMLFSKRKFHSFDNIESAKNWLAAN